MPYGGETMASTFKFKILFLNCYKLLQIIFHDHHIYDKTLGRNTSSPKIRLIGIA